MNIETMDSTNIKQVKQPYQLCSVERLLCHCNKDYKNGYTLRRHQATVCAHRGKKRANGSSEQQANKECHEASDKDNTSQSPAKKRCLASYDTDRNVQTHNADSYSGKPSTLLEKIFSRRTNTKETISEKTADGAPEQQTNKERHEASDKDNENQSPAKKRFLLSYTRKPPTLLENILSRRPKETISINADVKTPVEYREVATQTDALQIEVKLTACGKDKLTIKAVPSFDN